MRGARSVGLVYDLDEDSLEAIKRGGELRIAGSRGALAVEAVGREQVAGFCLYRRGCGCGVRMVEFDQEPLGAIEMVAHNDKDDGPRGLVVACQLRRLGTVMLPLPASEESDCHEQGAGGDVAERLPDIE